MITEDKLQMLEDIYRRKFLSKLLKISYSQYTNKINNNKDRFSNSEATKLGYLYDLTITTLNQYQDFYKKQEFKKNELELPFLKTNVIDK